MLETQFARNAESRAAGMVINTMGWIEGTGYEVMKSKPYNDVNADKVRFSCIDIISINVSLLSFWCFGMLLM